MMLEIFAFNEVDEKEGRKRNGEVDWEEDAEEETRNAVADMSHVDDGGENDRHKDIGEGGGFEVAENAAFSGDWVVTIEGEDDEVWEKEIEENGGVFEVAEGDIGRVPTETREVWNQKGDGDGKNIC